MPDVLPTNDEILQALTDKVTATGVDSWRIKVFRRPGAQHIMKHVATLGGAKLDQIANAENWLPQLGGGGPQYVLECFHPTDFARMIKGRLVFPIDGQEFIANPQILQDPSWQGPKQWLGPGQAPGSTQGTAIFGSPVQTPVGAQQGQSSNLAPTVAAQGNFDPRVDAVMQRFEQAQKELEALRARHEIERAKEVAAQREQEAQRRIEEKEREHRREMEALRRELEAAKVPVKSGPSVTEIVAAAGAAFQPMFAMWTESRKQEAEDRRRRDELEREERRHQIEEDRRRNDEAQRRNDLLFQKLLEPKPLIDPAIEKLLQTKKEDPSAIADAFGRMAGTTMKMMSLVSSTVQDRDPDNPALQIMGEVRKGLETLVGALQGPQPVLHLESGPAGASAQGYQAPAAVQQAARPPQAAQPAPQPQQAQPANLLQSLVQRIKAFDDVNRISVDFMDALDEGKVQDQSVRTAMDESGWDAIKLFEKYVGQAWAVQNQAYAMKLASALQAESNKREAEDDAEVVEDGEAEQPEAEA